MAYKYEHVEVLRVLDGDTVELRIDMGNRTQWVEKFRLYGIDTPEIRGPNKEAGEAAANRLRELLAGGVTLAETFKPDKYGRTLVSIWIFYNGFPYNAAKVLISEGHGKEYFGGKK